MIGHSITAVTAITSFRDMPSLRVARHARGGSVPQQRMYRASRRGAITEKAVIAVTAVIGKEGSGLNHAEHVQAEHVQAEKVEKELNVLIERRAAAMRKSGEEEHIERLWAESAVKESLTERRRRRAAWYSHHEHMREVHSRLAREHEAKAMELLEGDAS